MKIPLPNYDYKFEDDSAEVKDGMLYIYKPGSLKDVMYKLTYLVYGATECYFCHRKLRTSDLGVNNNQFFTKMTLDHLVPHGFNTIMLAKNNYVERVNVIVLENVFYRGFPEWNVETGVLGTPT